MKLSLMGIAFPALRRRASSAAHSRPVSASQGRQCKRPAPASNQRSSAVLLLPLGRIKMPNRSSPRITGSTAISGSWTRSHATTRGSGVGFVGSLKTLASTRYFTKHPSTQRRWRRKSPSVDMSTANRSRPRWEAPPAGRGDSPRDQVARRRIPVRVLCRRPAGTPQAERSALGKKRWSS